MNKHLKQPASIKTQLMFHANLQKTFYLAALLIYTTHCQWFFQMPHYKEHLHESSTFFQENSSFTAPSFSYALLFAKSPCHTVQFSSVAQSCPTLCDPMNHRTPGLPVHHQLPESTQTHVHCVGDAIQPSHPPLSPSPPALNLSQRHFQMSQLSASGGQSIGVSALASLLPKNTQGWSPLEWTGWISLQSKGLSRVFSNTTIQKHQFFGAQHSL